VYRVLIVTKVLQFPLSHPTRKFLLHTHHASLHKHSLCPYTMPTNRATRFDSLSLEVLAALV